MDYQVNYITKKINGKYLTNVKEICYTLNIKGRNVLC